MDKSVRENDFYRSLAHLFYAIATIDNRTEKLEKIKIKEVVETNWTFKSDQIDSQKIIFSTLKELFNEKLEAEDAFMNFRDFFLENEKMFTERVKKVILNDTDKIAQSFSQRNKSESVLISRLYFLMNENE